jgi:hypothetical protein
VEYARTFLMSFWVRPIVAAKNAVAPPITATTKDASCVRSQPVVGWPFALSTAHTCEMRKKMLQRATM